MFPNAFYVDDYNTSKKKILSFSNQPLHFIAGSFHFISGIWWGCPLKYWIQVRRTGWHPWLIPEGKIISFKIFGFWRIASLMLILFPLLNFWSGFHRSFFNSDLDIEISLIIFTITIKLILHFPFYVSTLQAVPKPLFQDYLPKRLLILIR